MDDSALTAALRERAARDAAQFLEQHPGETPNLKWVENSYTAALALAKDSAGSDVALDGNPQLFDVYRAVIAERLGGIRADVGEGEAGSLTQQPTPGEHR